MSKIDAVLYKLSELFEFYRNIKKYKIIKPDGKQNTLLTQIPIPQKLSK